MKSTQDVFTRRAFIAKIVVLCLIFLKRFCTDVFSEGKDAFRNGRIGNHDVWVVRNGYSSSNHLSGTCYASLNVEHYVLLSSYI
jgi:hypothetical protein